jgi:uroporphyrinogen decarboxylase
MIDKVKNAGKLVFFHSDGYIIDIIDDLIEMGVDALNAQVWCMDLEELGNRFNGRICFWGELDRQHIMPYGTPDDIHAAAQKMKACLSNPAGGLIGQAEPGLEVSLENIEAVLKSWN